MRFSPARPNVDCSREPHRLLEISFRENGWSWRSREDIGSGAVYLEELREEYAKLLTVAFKHTMQLEFWRHTLDARGKEVRDLHKKWNSEGKPSADPSKRVWEQTQTTEDYKPEGGLSKKARREIEE